MNSIMDSSAKVLSSKDLELYALCEACDIDMDPQIFRILLDLLRLDVSPIEAIVPEVIVWPAIRTDRFCFPELLLVFIDGRLSGAQVARADTRILLDLLRLDVSPIALFHVLQSLSLTSQKAEKPPVAAKPKSLLKESNTAHITKRKDPSRRYITEQRGVY